MWWFFPLIAGVMVASASAPATTGSGQTADETDDRLVNTITNLLATGHGGDELPLTVAIAVYPDRDWANPTAEDYEILRSITEVLARVRGE